MSYAVPPLPIMVPGYPGGMLPGGVSTIPSFYRPPAYTPFRAVMPAYRPVYPNRRPVYPWWRRGAGVVPSMYQTDQYLTAYPGIESGTQDPVAASAPVDTSGSGSGLPIVPILIGVGALGAVATVLVMLKKKKARA